MVHVPLPFATGLPTSSLDVVSRAKGAQSVAPLVTPLVDRLVSLRKPVPVLASPPVSVQSEEANVPVAASTVTRTVTR